MPPLKDLFITREPSAGRKLINIPYRYPIPIMQTRSSTNKPIMNNMEALIPDLHHPSPPNNTSCNGELNRSADSSSSSSSHPYEETGEDEQRYILREHTLTRSTSSNSLVHSCPGPSRSPKKSHKSSPYPKGAHTRQPDREKKLKETKERALKIKSTGKTPATEHQRLVLLMVYEEITPYPDEAWISQLGVLINREYHQVKNWFSNQRQKDSRANRENSPAKSTSPPPHESNLCRFQCDGRPVRVRRSAITYCQEEDWSDDFFEEVVMIHNFRILVRLRREEAGIQ